MRFFAFIVVIGAIVFFIPKMYTVNPGSISQDELKAFNSSQKKCIGFKIDLEIKGENNSTQNLCAGWLLQKDYVDVLDELTQK